MTDDHKKTSEKMTSAEVDAMKARYKLPEERVRAESPADGYMMGIHFVLSALLPALLGMWLDKALDTKPWLFVVLLILGFASGFWYVWRKWQAESEK